MKIIKTGDEFLAEMEARFGPPEDFHPTATYIPDGDCIEFIARPGPYRAQRLDDLVTVYLSEADDEIVGSLIKGIQKLCRQLTEKLPGFKVNVDDGRIRLEHLFLAYTWSEPLQSKLIQRTYRKLIEAAEATKAEADLCVV
ncbi:MAG TPA: hypothetical protein VFE47_10700 [Tepidisphaeraceae bacterium]|jgi:DNA repair exonuclease SbcCD ATPase subunit|nr:hypothetical protein [Tepidisphaeraceae bacterium]